MTKLDLRKQFKPLYQPSAKKVEVVDVPPLKFAMLDGEIEPGASPGTSPAFQQAVEALYGISYTLKFNSKLRSENPLDYTVMVLEGLWWVDVVAVVLSEDSEETNPRAETIQFWASGSGKGAETMRTPHRNDAAPVWVSTESHASPRTRRFQGRSIPETPSYAPQHRPGPSAALWRELVRWMRRNHDHQPTVGMASYHRAG